MRTRIWKKRMVAIILAFVMVMGVVSVPASTSYTTVEAASKKKDKKKPVITMKGKSKMTVTKGKSVKIPKVTAKDNKDGNVTKKIKVTVKKGKKSFASIAKKIKNNKKVKFTATGKYVITYTVTDKAGNKATKKRTITVKAPSKTNNTETTTETSTEEVTYTEVIVNGQTFKVCKDYNIYSEIMNAYNQTGTNIPTVSITNDYSDLYFNKASGLLTNSQYLQYLGGIKATDSAGNDISNDIVIYELNLVDGFNTGDFATNPEIYIYVKDSKGNALSIPITLHFRSYIVGDDYDENTFASQGLTFLSSNPVVYGKRRNRCQAL